MIEEPDELRSPVATVFALTVAVLLNAVVLSWLWEWFVAKKFGVSSLSVAHSAGIFAIAMLFTATYRKATAEKEAAIEYFFIFYIRPLVALALGWIAHLFM